MSDELPVVCQVCWASGQTIGKRCWLCHSVVKDVEKKTDAETQPTFAKAIDQPLDAILIEPANPYSPPRSLEDSNAYKSNSILLLITVVLVTIVVTAVVPGLGFPLCIVVLPALVRTVTTINNKRAKGIQLTTQEKVKTFAVAAAASLAATFTAAVACAAAFFCACLIICGGGGGGAMNEGVFFAIVGACCLVSLGGGIYLFLYLTRIHSD